jgi:tetratricopeptide (TPR) repeat protein
VLTWLYQCNQHQIKESETMKWTHSNKISPVLPGILVFIQIIVITCFLEIRPLKAQEPEQASQILFNEDLAAYQSSKYASSKWDAHVKAGLEAFHTGNYDVAQNNLYKAFNSGCESPLVLFQLALINEYQKSFYSALEFYQMAKKGFESSHKNHRYHLEFYENYGRALYYSGKIAEALPILSKASKATKSFWLLKLLGMIAYEQGDTLNATSYFERAVRIQSSDVTREELIYIYGLLAKLFLVKGETDGAYRYYVKVLELDPNNQDARAYTKKINNSYQKNSTLQVLEQLKEF